MNFSIDPKGKSSLFSSFIILLVGVNALLALAFFDIPIFNISSGGDSVQRTAHKIDVSNLNQGQFPELREVSNYVGDFKDLSNFFEALAEDKGAEYSYNVLRLAELPPGTDLHLLGHVVGDVLFKQQGLEGIHVCTQDFRNACSHSLVIALFYEEGEGALEDISATCREAPGGRGAYTMCFHGLGHGVLSYAGYDLEKTVDLCRQTGTPEYGNREFVECVGGSIMEIIGGVHDREAWQRQYEKYFKEEDPLYPCSADFMPDSVKPICYNYLTPHLFTAAGGRLSDPSPVFEKAFSYCDAVPKERIAERTACYGGFGKEFIVLTKERDIRDIDIMTPEQIQRVHDWCALAADKDGQHDCLMFAMSSMYWGGENTYDTALGLCDIVADSGHRENCFDNLISAVFYYRGSGETEYLRSFCESLPKEFAERCSVRTN